MFHPRLNLLDLSLISARLSSLAYFPYHVSDKKGLESFTFIESDPSSYYDTQCVIAQYHNYLLISFRGTDLKQDKPSASYWSKFKDWLTNIDFISKEDIYNGSDKRAHRGFVRALNDIYPSIKEEVLLRLARNPHIKLIVTGHSLGGALALLAYLNLSSLFEVDYCITFGQPKEFGLISALNLNRMIGDRIIRYINHSDIVPSLPPSIFNYFHIGRRFYINRNGELKLDASLWYILLDRLVIELKSLVDITPDLIDDHSIEDYETAIKLALAP